jgi:hypothetical protein
LETESANPQQSSTTKNPNVPLETIRSERLLCIVCRINPDFTPCQVLDHASDSIFDLFFVPNNAHRIFGIQTSQPASIFGLK